MVDAAGQSGGAVWLLLVRTGETALSGWQTAVGGLITFDLAGGLVANATSTTKRWYHRPGQSAWQHLGFVFPHLLQEEPYRPSSSATTAGK